MSRMTLLNISLSTMTAPNTGGTGGTGGIGELLIADEEAADDEGERKTDGDEGDRNGDDVAKLDASEDRTVEETPGKSELSCADRDGETVTSDDDALGEGLDTTLDRLLTMALGLMLELIEADGLMAVDGLDGAIDGVTDGATDDGTDGLTDGETEGLMLVTELGLWGTLGDGGTVDEGTDGLTEGLALSCVLAEGLIAVLVEGLEGPTLGCALEATEALITVLVDMPLEGTLLGGTLADEGTLEAGPTEGLML